MSRDRYYGNIGTNYARIIEVFEPRTRSMKSSEIKKEWLVVDAADATLGRLASEIARVLRGKHKPSYTPHLDCGDNVIVVNADKLSLVVISGQIRFTIITQVISVESKA